MPKTDEKKVVDGNFEEFEDIPEEETQMKKPENKKIETVKRWGKKAVKIAAAIGAGMLIGKLLGGKKGGEDDDEDEDEDED